MVFEWDEGKADKNLIKHGISFDEAKTVFDDPDHSENEDRYLIVGESNTDRLLIISYTERGNAIRLISARETTKTERETYEEG